MKELKVAQSAGFCFGVSRSVKMAEQMLSEESSCFSFGELIHNADVVSNLEQKGLRVTSDPDVLGEGDAVIIRSHGITKALCDKLASTRAKLVDATCPRVKHIHNIVVDASENHRQPVIIGAKDHPEVQAICGWCKNPIVAGNAEELEALINSGVIDAEQPITMVIQTTQTKDKLLRCEEVLHSLCKDVEIHETICGATSTRQNEARALSKECDAMIVIGAKHSANSRHLNEICRENCQNVQFIENASQLDRSALEMTESVGLTAGASVPAWIIQEVIDAIQKDI